MGNPVPLPRLHGNSRIQKINMKKQLFPLLALLFLISCQTTTTEVTEEETDFSFYEIDNPIFGIHNADIDFAGLTAEDIIEATDYAKKRSVELMDAIIAVPQDEKNFSNTMVALDETYDVLNRASGVIGLMSAAHPDSTIRTTAQEKDTEISQFYNEISLNEDLYKAIKGYSTTDEATGLEGWQAKNLEETLIEFERNGFALDAADREKLKEIKNEISQLGDAFNQNLNSYSDFMYLTEDEMGGLSEDYKKARLQDDGTYEIGVAYPDIRPFFRNATNADARKELLRMYTNRAADTNMDILNDLIKKRTEMANLLGYETYADYNLAAKMAKDPETVQEFQMELKEMVTPKGYADLEEMATFAREELGMEGDVVEPWSRSFVTDKLLKQNYGVDVEEVRQYFPIENVIDGLFTITQNLFDLEYKPMDDASVWHEDVSGYYVYDDGKHIGSFYLDLHPRANKYNHAACFPIIIGRNTEQGFQKPVSSLECNFTAPTEDKPALLTHGEVETFFHEFGHVLHSIVTTAELGSQSGFFVSRDFVEAPSQIFENWVWNYESLELFAKHYETGEVMPKELFDKMLASKNVMSGRNTLYQIFLGQLDMTLHGGFDPDGDKTITQVREELDREINLTEPFEDSRMAASFGHLNGYGASYYGYLWSKVFAQDMFSRFEEEGIFSEDAGLDYKKYILAAGATKDEMDMLRDYLGRDPQKDAFIRSLGLETEEVN